MSKVLISLIGTGSQDKNGTNPRAYRLAKYKFSDGSIEESSFFAIALANYYNVDKIILMGTVHSMWEEVYNAFSKRSGIEPEDEICMKLYDDCDKANFNSPLSLPYWDKLENSLGKDSKAILLHYGINEEELKVNMEKILAIEQYLNSGDELIVDVTHSFRSQTVFMMTLINLLQNVSRKNVTISHISYGMIDIAREMPDKCAPVVELNSIIELSQWITGAYSLQKLGNANVLVNLLKKKEKTMANALENFSNIMSLNQISKMPEMKHALTLLQKSSDPLVQIIIGPVIENIKRTFSIGLKGNLSRLQFIDAKWQFEHYNYSNAFMSAEEAIITKAFEVSNFPQDKIYDTTERNKVKNKLCKGMIESPIAKDLKVCFDEIVAYRNSITHVIVDKKKKKEPFDKKKKEPFDKKKEEPKLKDFIPKLKNVLNSLEEII